jgi:hypothetical protein
MLGVWIGVVFCFKKKSCPIFDSWY